MMSFLQTGKALYVLAAICLAGVFTRLIAASTYSAFPVCKKLIIVKAPLSSRNPSRFYIILFFGPGCWLQPLPGLGSAPAVRRFPVKSIIATDFDLGS